MDRRQFLGWTAGMVGSGLILPVGQSACAIAGNTPDNQPGANTRMVVVFLRGAVDGLNVVVPYGDAHYYQARPTIAVARPGAENGALDLDGYFGLHPALAPLMPYWQRRQLAFVHASGSPDPTRSHFDAQNYMETGVPGRASVASGWMNRTLADMQASAGQGRSGSDARHDQIQTQIQAVNIGDIAPRILAGQSAVANVSSGRGNRRSALDRPDIARQFGTLYSNDAMLGRSFQQGRADREEISHVLDDSQEQKMANNGARLPDGLSVDAAKLARLMQAKPDIRLGFLAAGGWDTHVNQGNGTGQLASRLRPLALGLVTLAGQLGPLFDDTVIVVMSEFGRTFKENGNGGTDHGHGNVMWLMGGALQGGKIYGHWPGLDNHALHENRDLAITTDFRTVLASLAQQHLHLPDQALTDIFPDFGTRPASAMRFFA